MTTTRQFAQVAVSTLLLLVCGQFLLALVFSLAPAVRIPAAHESRPLGRMQSNSASSVAGHRPLRSAYSKRLVGQGEPGAARSW